MEGSLSRHHHEGLPVAADESIFLSETNEEEKHIVVLSPQEREELRSFVVNRLKQLSLKEQ